MVNKKNLSLDGYTDKFSQVDYTVPISQKIGKETLPDSFHEAYIGLMPKADKDLTRK